jgi:uncharacterized protein with HEPN domain
MTDRNPIVYFLHMRDYALEAREMVEDPCRSDLDQNGMFSRAMERLVGLIGEAAGNVPPATRRRFPDIRWRPMIGMRNHLIHGYEYVDYDVVWKTLIESLPELLEQLDRAIAELESETDQFRRGDDDDPA